MAVAFLIGIVYSANVNRRRDLSAKYLADLSKIFLGTGVVKQIAEQNWIFCG